MKPLQIPGFDPFEFWGSVANRPAAICLVVLWVLASVAGAAWAGNPTEKTNMPAVKRVYFYLVEGSVSAFDVASQTNLADLRLEASPLFSSDDIVRYDITRHSFVLTEEADGKVRKLKIPLEGKPFVVCVGKRRVYLGAFWATLSSFVFDGPTIVQPWRKNDRELVILPRPLIVKGDRSWTYLPGPPPNVPDPRNDPEVLEIMKSRGKPTEKK